MTYYSSSRRLVAILSVATGLVSGSSIVVMATGYRRHLGSFMVVTSLMIIVTSSVHGESISWDFISVVCWFQYGQNGHCLTVYSVTIKLDLYFNKR